MVQAYEAIYSSGTIHLAEDVKLPENTKVYVVVLGGEENRPIRIMSPRLADPSQAAYFEKEMVVEEDDAQLR